MRFRFCGDLDCPDWLLAEISTLSKLSSVKMKLLCAQVVADMTGHSIDYKKAAKLTSDAKFEIADIKAAIAALNFIFKSSARQHVDGETVSNELQQLGLPKEHANALSKIYDEKLDVLESTLRQQSMRVSRLKDVDWRVDYIISSSLLGEVGEPEVQVKIVKEDGINSESSGEYAFTIDGNNFRTFLAELKQAYKLLEDIS